MCGVVTAINTAGSSLPTNSTTHTVSILHSGLLIIFDSIKKNVTLSITPPGSSRWYIQCIILCDKIDSLASITEGRHFPIIAFVRSDTMF